MASLPVATAASLVISLVVAVGERILVDHEQDGLGQVLELAADVLGPDGGSFGSFVAWYCSCTPQATANT